MKAVFISFNQAHYEDVLAILDYHRVRGFTSWDPVTGRGSNTGEPHYGSHAWPTLNMSILSIVREDVVDMLLEDLHVLDANNDQLGLRAFVWSVEKTV